MLALTPAPTSLVRMTKARVLVVDDEENARRGLATLLAEEGFEVSEAKDGLEALDRVTREPPDVVLTDVRMPGLDGISLLKQAREAGVDSLFVVMTAFATIEAAVEAMRSGAENFLVKPIEIDAVTAVLEKVLEKKQLLRENEGLRTRVRERIRFSNIIGESTELQSVFEVIQRAAPTKATVLVLGESGTGKELIAQALHEQSPRKDRPFVKVNCAALPESLLESELFGHERGAFTGAVARKEGRFELADGGTLFLDEIGEISPSTQVKLLRVLQEREFERVGGTGTLKVDVRLVAATNRDLAAEVKAGRFREDLYYRLNVVSVTLPPLRERKADIPALAEFFLEKYGESYGKAAARVRAGHAQRAPQVRLAGQRARARERDRARGGARAGHRAHLRRSPGDAPGAAAAGPPDRRAHPRGLALRDRARGDLEDARDGRRLDEQGRRGARHLRPQDPVPAQGVLERQAGPARRLGRLEPSSAPPGGAP